MSTVVIVCTRNRPQDVALCLPSVLAAAQTAGARIFLIDQSTDTLTGQAVQNLNAASMLEYVPTGTVGKSVALNLALEMVAGRADADLLAFTDDDCEVPADWLLKYEAAFAADPTADVLFGPVAPSPAIADMENVCVPSWIFTEARDLAPGEVCGMGANMALRRAVLSRLEAGPYFDPLLGPGAPFPAGEEGDFVYRLRRAGARAALRPEIGVEHRAFRLPEKWLGVLTDYGRGDGAFYGKHARCGDAAAAQTLRLRLWTQTVRGLTKRLLGRSGADELSYVRGLRRGLRESREWTINPSTRLYVSQPPAAPRKTPHALTGGAL